MNLAGIALDQKHAVLTTTQPSCEPGYGTSGCDESDTGEQIRVFSFVFGWVVACDSTSLITR